MDHFDVVIVGAGSAGCALAARLTENADRSVLLLEAGTDFVGADGFPSELLDASVMAAARGGHPANWDLDARLTPSRSVSVPRGKVIGGSSTVNGGVFVRATAADFDRWAALGNDAWSFAEVLPFLRRMEDDRDFPDSPYHGVGGPIPVTRAPVAELEPLSHAFAAAAIDLGFPEELDKNAPGDPGLGPLPRNVVDGVRVNAALAYIAPNRGRANLTIESRVTARRVVFAGNRAVAVEADQAGTIRVFSGDEIVLCAGAAMTPKLLLVSGLGPAAALRTHDIEVVHDLPGVGARCHDHPQIFLAFEAAQPAAGHDAGIVEVSLDLDVDGAPVALMPYLTSMAQLVPGCGAPDSELVIGVLLERAESVVEVTLRSGDPDAPPVIDHHSLEDPADARRMRQAVELGLELIGSAAMKALGARPTAPADRAGLAEWIAANITTAVHLCSSAPMGSDSDPLAVVDQRCRVRGVDGLRVVDTSILPTAPSRGPAATAVLIGERAAAFFDGAAR